MKNKETVTIDSQATLMLAYLCVKDKDNLADQVEILDRFGFSSAQIATICGVAEGSVRNARMQGKKAKPAARRTVSVSAEKE